VRTADIHYKYGISYSANALHRDPASRLLERGKDIARRRGLIPGVEIRD